MQNSVDNSGDAVATANYIHNRIPHHGIKNKILFEILNNSKVDYSNLRVFGCKVLFYIPKVARSKFDNNAYLGTKINIHILYIMFS